MHKKNLFYFLYWSLLGVFLSCQNQEKKTPKSLSIATEDYVVLAEKTIIYQADFDMESWEMMLADDVEFGLPDGSPKSVVVGKHAAKEAWKSWRKRNDVQAMQCSNFTQIPVSSTEEMRFTELSGVYVFSLFKSKIIYTNGSHQELKMNYCFHFNQAKMIDRYYTFQDTINFVKN